MPAKKRQRVIPPSTPVAPLSVSAVRAEARKLPAHEKREAIINAVRSSRVVLVVGETGSGKTTQIPQFLQQSGLLGGKKVGITQPRRVAAVTVAKRVAFEMGVEIGSKVGYTIRFDDKTSPSTKIKFLTDGMLLREAMIDPTLSNYSVIILDEAHERSLHTDILIGFLKVAIAQNPNFRLVVMSATLDSELFVGFFETPYQKVPSKKKALTAEKIPVEVVHIGGRQYPVDVFYTYEAERDYLDAALVTVFQIHTEEDSGDVLVFLTGQEEIETMAQLIEDAAALLPVSKSASSKGKGSVRGGGRAGASLRIKVCCIFGAMASEQQLDAFLPAPPGTRKVILATNIAETSVTIPGVRHVIDPGLVKVRAVQHRTGMEILRLEPISQAQAWQRAGRAGREAPGKCYRLFTEDEFDRLRKDTISDVQRCGMGAVVLQLKALGVHDVLGFPFIERPPTRALRQAMRQLYTLGALGSKGELTKLGRQMSALPLEPTLAKMLLTAAEPRFGCARDMLAVVTMLAVTAESTLFFAAKKQGGGKSASDSGESARDIANAARRKLASAEGDHVTLLAVWEQYRKV
jgi:HrpA-like RNA helicase